ncbi:MAG: hypothetical protein LQ352_008125 [Teloschistes flavicans]|nr:MAG: hypothetical protein LQ352_008125 [Teloschistes flavicans]
MAPQTSIPPVANALGTIGTTLWCIQLVPQIWRNYSTKSTQGDMLVEESSFADPSSKWRTTTTILVLLVLIALFAGIQLLLIFLIRPAYHRGTSWPVTLVGVLAAVLLITGYIPVPFEIQKRRGRVIGIDFGFLTIDWLGAFFSLMAIATQNTVDVLGVVMYTVCATIEAGIFISHAIWLLRTRGIRRRAKAAETTWEDFPEAQAWQENRMRFPHWLQRRNADANEKSDSSTSANGCAGADHPSEAARESAGKGEGSCAEV